MTVYTLAGNVMEIQTAGMVLMNRKSFVELRNCASKILKLKISDDTTIE
jgi:hypothetical protein